MVYLIIAVVVGAILGGPLGAVAAVFAMFVLAMTVASYRAWKEEAAGPKTSVFDRIEREFKGLE